MPIASPATALGLRCGRQPRAGRLRGVVRPRRSCPSRGRCRASSRSPGRGRGCHPGELGSAEVADDRGVREHVERLGDQREERRAPPARGSPGRGVAVCRAPPRRHRRLVGMANQMKPRSHEVTDGNERAPARARCSEPSACDDDDWDKTQVGVASSVERGDAVQHAARPARPAGQGRRARLGGGFPFEFVTIAVSDGISMGHEGMRASLVSREVIADSVETVMHAERFDALVALAGCDKSLPGMLMAAARLNLPSVFVYGGSILPGHHNGVALDIVSVFEASAPARRARSPTTSSVRSSGRRARPRARAQACSPRTRWPRSARRSACRCPAARRRRLSTGAATTTPTHAGRAVMNLARARHPPASDHDQGGVRERDRGHERARRVDERGAASPRDGERGRGRAVARRLQRAWARASRTSPT